MLNSNAPRNRLRGGVILLCALAFLGIASVRAGEVEEAQKLLKAGQAPQALERVNRALAANPKDPQARFLKGPILTEPGKQKEPAKPPVVAQKAPEKPAAVAKPAADATAEVLKTVNAWAQAWSKKDADAYLAHYAKDFKAPGGEARADWEKGRRSRIAAPKSIAVGVESAKVTMRNPQQASVSFRQTYRSDKLSTKSRKTLELVKADGRWLIKEEKAGK